jgi:hypothetical protein
MEAEDFELEELVIAVAIGLAFHELDLWDDADGRPSHADRRNVSVFRCL